MQCLQPVRPFPHTSFGEARGSQSDPLKFPLRLSVPGESYPSSCRSPYLSPPMSGSPPPENLSDPIRGTKRRRQSASPSAVTPVTRQLPEPLPTYTNHNSIKTPSSKISVSVPQQQTTQTAPRLVGFPPVNEGQSPHLLPAFGAPASISPRATALPPRSTRRAKAHVASACVNCKRKHLGCDSARPCRRCVVAGKEDSCVDVTHKRRGRPPLKAEEGPIRTYESTYGHSAILRVSQHPTNTSSTPRGHKRASSSREIRPSTEFHLSRPFNIGHSDRRPGPSPTMSMQPPPWTPHLLPSPSATVPPPSLAANSYSGRSTTSNDQLLTQQRPPILSSGGRNPAFPRPLSEISPIRPLSGEGLPYPTSPHMQYKPRSPTDSSCFSSPGPSNSGPFAPLQRVTANNQFPEPGLSSIRLPPILPRTTLVSESERPRTTERPKSLSSLPWMDSQTSLKPTGANRNALSAPLYPGPPLRRGSENSYSSGRSSSGHELPPILHAELQQQKQSHHHHHHHSSPPQSQQTLQAPKGTATTPTKTKRKAASLGEENGTEEAGSRPVRRLKMELGEMVND